jgi:hypothetical protein
MGIGLVETETTPQKKEDGMLRKLCMLFMATSILTLPVSVFSAPIFKTGDMELSLAGSGSSDKDFDATTTSVEGTLGHFFSPTLEAIFRQGIGFSDTPNGSDWNGSTRVGIDYNLPFSRYIPYFGASIGYLYGDSVKEQFIAGPEAGLKSFVNETTFILAAVEYQFLFEDTDDADDAFDDGRFVYTLGIGFKW